MKKTNTHDLVLAALCAALTAVVAPFSIAIGPISLTLSVFAVLFTGAVGLDTFGFTKGVAALCVFAGVWLVTKSKSRAQLDAERAAAEQAPENRPRA